MYEYIPRFAFSFSNVALLRPPLCVGLSRFLTDSTAFVVPFGDFPLKDAVEKSELFSEMPHKQFLSNIFFAMHFM